MSQPHMDHNDLARLLDGTLSEEERGSVLAHLADADEDVDVLGDAAYLLREAEEEGVSAGDGAETGRDPEVIPLRPPSTRGRTWRRAPARWLALAAMVAGVLLVPLVLSRSGSRGTGDFAVLLKNREAGLPAGWLDQPPWRVTRGPGDVAAENALAARIGALNVDLDLAITARQAEQAETLAGQIAYLLENASWTGPGLIARNYREISRRANEPSEDLAASLDEARDALPGALDADHLNFGAWLEAARLAAASRDAAFFRRRASRKMQDRAALLVAADPEARAMLGAIRDAARPDPPDWTVLETQTKALLGQIAS